MVSWAPWNIGVRQLALKKPAHPKVSPMLPNRRRMEQKKALHVENVDGCVRGAWRDVPIKFKMIENSTSL